MPPCKGSVGEEGSNSICRNVARGKDPLKHDSTEEEVVSAVTSVDIDEKVDKEEKWKTRTVSVIDVKSTYFTN
jgi:hypothetical protein